MSATIGLPEATTKGIKKTLLSPLNIILALIVIVFTSHTVYQMKKNKKTFKKVMSDDAKLLTSPTAIVTVLGFVTGLSEAIIFQNLKVYGMKNGIGKLFIMPDKQTLKQTALVLLIVSVLTGLLTDVTLKLMVKDDKACNGNDKPSEKPKLKIKTIKNEKVTDFAIRHWVIIAMIIIILYIVCRAYTNRRRRLLNGNSESNFAGTPSGSTAPVAAPAPAPSPAPAPAPSLVPDSGSLAPVAGPTPEPTPTPTSGGSGTGGHHGGGGHHRPYPYPYPYPFPYYPYNYGTTYLLDTFDGGSRSTCYRRVTMENGRTVCMSRREYIIYVKGRKSFWSEKLVAAKASDESPSKISAIKKKLNRVNDILDSEGVS